MKNSDMPAMPIQPVERLIEMIATANDKPKILDDFIETFGGLTKREYFASKAPENPPKWFEEKCHSEWSVEECEEYFFDDRANCGFTNKGKEFIYFAWRSHYADALLKELEK